MDVAVKVKPGGDHAIVSRLRFGGYVILTPDLARSVDWHVGVLGFKVVGRGEFQIADGDEVLPIQQAFLEGMGVALEIMSSPRTRKFSPWPAPPRHLYNAAFQTIIIQTEDVAEITRQLDARGASFVWVNSVLPDGNACSLITDPDGNLYELLGPPGVVGDEKIKVQAPLEDYPPKKALGPPRLAENIKEPASRS